MKRKTSNTRDSCSICRAAKRNPTGHDQKFCAYPGGPFEHLGFIEAIKAARTDAKRRRTERPAAVAQRSNEQTPTTTGLPAEAIAQLHTDIRNVRESTAEVEHYQADLRKGVNDGIDNVAHCLGRIMKLEKQVADLTRARNAQQATITRIESFLQDL